MCLFFLSCLSVSLWSHFFFFFYSIVCAFYLLFVFLLPFSILLFIHFSLVFNYVTFSFCVAIRWVFTQDTRRTKRATELFITIKKHALWSACFILDVASCPLDVVWVFPLGLITYQGYIFPAQIPLLVCMDTCCMYRPLKAGVVASVLPVRVSKHQSPSSVLGIMIIKHDQVRQGTTNIIKKKHQMSNRMERNE